MEQHGEVLIETTGRVVCVSYVGAINDIAIQQNRPVYQRHALALSPGPWGSFADIRHWELGTPEALEEIRLTRLWAIEHGMCHQATLALPGAIARLHEKRYRGDMPSTFELRYFDQRDAAFAWLSEMGYLA